MSLSVLRPDLPRPLVRSLDPGPGESLAGYVRRLAHRLDRTPAAITDRVGLRPADSHATAGLTLSLPPSALAALAAACSLDEDEAVGLTLARYVGTVLAQDGRAGKGSLVHQAAAAWITPGRTRYCPDCLVGDDGLPGYWRSSWQLPWHFACLRHLRLLADDCPACGAVVGRAAPRGPLTALVPNPGVAALPVDACRYRPGDGPGVCGHRLSVQDDDGRDFRDAAAGADVITAQQRLDDLLGLDHPPDVEVDPPTVGGVPVPLPSWVPALQAVAALVRAALGLPGSPPPDHALAGLQQVVRDPAVMETERRRRRHGNTPPDGAWETAGLVVRALHVLDAPDRDQLEARLAPYREPLREHSPVVWKGWLQTHPDPHLRRLLKRHSRWGGLVVATARRPQGDGLRGSALSQRIPAPHDRLLDPYRGLGVSDTGLHRVTSVLLYQRAEGTLRRADAAAALGYDEPQHVDGTAARLTNGLAAVGLTDAYQETLDDLAAFLAAEPPVDWARRRAALVDWTVPDADWQALRDALRPLQKPHGRQPDWGLRRLVVGQVVWEDLTRAEPFAGPAFRLLPSAGKERTRLRFVSQQFRSNIAEGRLPGFAAVIDAYRLRVETELVGPGAT